MSPRVLRVTSRSCGGTLPVSDIRFSPRRESLVRISILIVFIHVTAQSVQGRNLPSLASTDFWAVHPWELWAATPSHKKLCKSNGRCYSLQVISSDLHIFQFQDNQRYSVTAILPSGGIGVLRDFGDGQLRCFSDSIDSCSPARYPPGYSPDYAIIPILPAPSINTPTPGAQISYAIESEQVNNVDINTCAVTWIGEIIHSGSHFLLSSYDFGPPLGTLANIYVTEEAMGCPPSAIGSTHNPMHCQRLERYFFSPSLGRIRQEGWQDPTCDGIDPESCQGNYSVASPGIEIWMIGDGGPVTPMVEICP